MRAAGLEVSSNVHTARHQWHVRPSVRPSDRPSCGLLLPSLGWLFDFGRATVGRSVGRSVGLWGEATASRGLLFLSPRGPFIRSSVRTALVRSLACSYQKPGSFKQSLRPVRLLLARLSTRLRPRGTRGAPVETYDSAVDTSGMGKNGAIKAGYNRLIRTFDLQLIPRNALSSLRTSTAPTCMLSVSLVRINCLDRSGANNPLVQFPWPRKAVGGICDVSVDFILKRFAIGVISRTLRFVTYIYMYTRAVIRTLRRRMVRW